MVKNKEFVYVGNDWFTWFLRIMIATFVILLILILIKEGFPLP